MVSSEQSQTLAKSEFDARRWAHAAFGVAALILVWIGINLVADLWDFLRAVWSEVIPRPTALLARVIGTALGLVSGLTLWRSKKSFAFVSEVVTEVSQIVWPTRDETRLATIVVVVFTLVCSGILAMMDTFWQAVTNWIYDL